MKDEGTLNPDNHDVISARELAKSVERDPEQFDEKHKHDELHVRGEVFEVRNVVSAVVVRMCGLGETYSGVDLEWHMSNRDDAEQIRSGDTVSLRGRYEGHRTGTSPTGEEITWIRFTRAVLEE